MIGAIQRLPSAWNDTLRISGVNGAQLFQPGEQIPEGPHTAAITYALNELQLSAVLCVEDVPTIGFLSEQSDVTRIDEIHRSLWNQGLMSLLLVVRGDQLFAYSLFSRPFDSSHAGSSRDPRLIMTLSLVAQALQISELLESAASGRFWNDNASYFNRDDKVDSVLLSNLTTVFNTLRRDLGDMPAQALLMQTMFVAYLEDRGSLESQDFTAVSGDRYSTFSDILASGDVPVLEGLFAMLNPIFNGNMFAAPCSFGLTDTKVALQPHHLPMLAAFRQGRIVMTTGQLRLFEYDFKHIPVALISSVYDQFLKETAPPQVAQAVAEGQELQDRKATGAFYTPMFLADLVVSQLWEELDNRQRTSGRFFDPACGSGIFLVRLFQRMVVFETRRHKTSALSWERLTEIAERLHGADLNESAVRVAAVSLYIALLEQIDPPTLRTLMRRGRVLPSLYQSTLIGRNFIYHPHEPTYDAVIGNPPWKGRAGQEDEAQKWAKQAQLPLPAKDVAWAFVWKSLQVVRPNGVVAFLLPAMGVLHNVADKNAAARRRLIETSRVVRVINLSDLVFQLFDSAQRPACMVLFRPKADDRPTPYMLDYWIPKAGPNLKLRRMLTLSRADKLRLRSDDVSADAGLLKRRFWTRSPDERLLQYLKTLPPLNRFIKEFGDLNRRRISVDRQSDWVIGQGFQPAYRDKVEAGAYDVKALPELDRYPLLSVENYRPLTIPDQTESASNPDWVEGHVRRKGFVDGFAGPHIMIPQGVERSQGRIRATYTEQNIVFQHSLQAIAHPASETEHGKLLTAVLNSRLAGWFYFHETANIGTDRAKVVETELLKLPFAFPSSMPDPERASHIQQQLVDLVNADMARWQLFLHAEDDMLSDVDNLVYQYYDLTEAEIALVEDTFDYVIPALQPRASAPPALWMQSSAAQRAAYASSLDGALRPWLGTRVCSSLVAKSSDNAVLQLTLTGAGDEATYRETDLQDMGDVLDKIHAHLPRALSDRWSVVPDLRVAIGQNIYLVKPLEVRYWLRSTALAEADELAAELQAASLRTR